MTAPSRNDDVIFRLTGVSYRYMDRHPALDCVDLVVNRRDRVVILGANGCGKSTLLKVLDGLYRPQTGRMEAFGEDITDIADNPARSQMLHRRVGLVFQDADVQLFSPTVWDDVAFGPLQMGWPEGEVRRRVADTLTQMDVAHLSDRAPYELSGGEKKRVAIASVLALEPEVLLLDEPTANLDPRSKAALVDTIALLGRAGRTIVLATQELEIVPAVATRVILFGDRERRPVAEGDIGLLADTDLLVRVNLLHEHLHYHEGVAHSHSHHASREHRHDSDESEMPACEKP
jgi:cobalt/nickel transport system ATP-binding protein